MTKNFSLPLLSSPQLFCRIFIACTRVAVRSARHNFVCFAALLLVLFVCLATLLGVYFVMKTIFCSLPAQSLTGRKLLRVD